MKRWSLDALKGDHACRLDECEAEGSVRYCDELTLTDRSRSLRRLFLVLEVYQ